MPPLTRYQERQMAASSSNSADLSNDDDNTPTVNTTHLENPQSMDLATFDLLAQGRSLSGVHQLMLSSDTHRRLGAQHLGERLLSLLRAYKIDDPPDFVEMMEARDVVLAGHAVLRFVLGVDPSPHRSGLNVYVGVPDQARFTRYLNSNDFWVVQGNRIELDHDAHSITGVRTIIRFAKFEIGGPSYTRINLVVVDRRADRTRPIAFLPTTASMTYITARAIHVTFPHHTFRMEALITTNRIQGLPDTLSTDLATLSSAARNHVEKLRRDGFDVRWPTVASNPFNLGGDCGFACAAKRVTASEDTLIIPLAFSPLGDGESMEVPLRLVRLGQLMVSYVNFLMAGKCQQPMCETGENRKGAPLQELEDLESN